MITIKIIRLLHLACYLVIVSQLMYYVFVMGDALKMVRVENFVEQRKVVDPLVHKRHIPFYYASILLSIMLIVMTGRQWASPLFISAVIAFLCLATDVLIGSKGNGPINNFVNVTATNAPGVNWEQIRMQWLHLVKIRGVISMFGFLSLLAGLVFTNG